MPYKGYGARIESVMKMAALSAILQAVLQRLNLQYWVLHWLGSYLQHWPMAAKSNHNTQP